MSQLPQLPSADHALLMYLAGELSAEDRAEMDRRLASDEALRAALDRVRAADQAVLAGLGRLDEVDPLPVDPAAAVRNVSRAMRQWAAKPTQLQPMRIQSRQRAKLPVWLIAGAAAAIIVALGISLMSRKADVPLEAEGPLLPQIPPEFAERRDFNRELMASLSSLPETSALLPPTDREPSAGALDNRSIPSLDGALADAQVFEIPLDPSELVQP